LNPHLHDVIIRCLSLTLPFLASSKHRYFAWVLAFELAISACYLQITWIFRIYDGIYYDVILLYHSLLFVMILNYKAGFSALWHRNRFDAFTALGTLLFLANAIYYLGMIGEFLINEVLKTTKSMFFDAYNDIMRGFQIIQFILLISVIDFGRIINLMSNSSLGNFFVSGGRLGYNVVYDNIIKKFR